MTARLFCLCEGQYHCVICSTDFVKISVQVIDVLSIRAGFTIAERIPYLGNFPMPVLFTEFVYTYILWHTNKGPPHVWSGLVFIPLF